MLVELINSRSLITNMMNLSRRRRGQFDNEGAKMDTNKHIWTTKTSKRRLKKEESAAKWIQLLVKPLLACLVFVIGIRFFKVTRPAKDGKSQNEVAIAINVTTTTISTTQATAAAITTTTTTTVTSRQALLRRNSSTAPTKVNNRLLCSCLNTSASRHCCERVIFRAHKFGTILVDSLFGSFRRLSPIPKIELKQMPKYVDNATLPTSLDYRHVVVTRNWFDAIVSGYLYHRAGYECWMNARGEKRRIVRREDWDTQLTFLNESLVPPRNNRSICSYLSDESEEDGIRVVMEIALSKWYKGVVPYWNLVQGVDDGNKSLFICYEDLVDPYRQEEIFHKILEWIFPAGEARDASLPVSMRASLEEQKHNSTVYSGRHATENDPELRTRLRDMVKSYDRRLFNNTVASSDAIFGCGG